MELTLPETEPEQKVPQIKIGEDNYWYVSNDGGQTWTSLGVKATGDKGDTGAAGTDGTTPQLKIGTDNLWYVSYDGGQTWTSLGVKATGDKGDTGSAGEGGLIPYIGPNGNWWLGTTDTGVKAVSEMVIPANAGADEKADSDHIIAIIAIIIAGLALAGNIGLIVYIAKKKKSIV